MFGSQVAGVHGGNHGGFNQDGCAHPIQSYKESNLNRPEEYLATKDTLGQGCDYEMMYYRAAVTVVRN